MEKFDPKSLFTNLGSDYVTERLEDNVLNVVVARLGLYDVKRYLLQSSEQERGKPELTFEGFHTAVADFPILLGAKHFKSVDSKLSITKMVTDFGNLPMVKAWDSLCSSYGEAAKGLPVGLVFNWPAKFKYLVIHNREIDIDVTGTRLAIWHNETTGERLIIEPLDLLLDSIAKSRRR